MPIKIFLKRAFLVLPTLPHTFKSLVHDMSKHFDTLLPRHWSFEYLDNYGKIRQSGGQDYEEFRRFLSQQYGTEIKVDIIPVEKAKNTIGSEDYRRPVFEEVKINEQFYSGQQRSLQSYPVKSSNCVQEIEYSKIYRLQDVQVKVAGLQNFFPEANFDKLWNFVDNAPKDMTVDDLALNCQYMS